MNRKTNPLLRPHAIAEASGLSRRQMLARSSALLAGAFGASTLGYLAMGSRPAYAADYKALVCIFLLGGCDGMNVVVPTDTTRYNQYAGVRGAAGLALPQSSLVGLTGSSYGPSGTTAPLHRCSTWARCSRRSPKTSTARSPTAAS
jgi:uncharacterized protein (DUF1501 family)